jgi:hypothetical protein
MSNGFKLLIALLLGVLIGVVALELAGQMVIAQLFSMFGTIEVLAGMMIWIVFIDSKKRWPRVGWFDRFARVITFYRD